MASAEHGEGSSSPSAKDSERNCTVRITSVQLETSGEAIRIVAGGFSFSLPIEKARTLVSMVRGDGEASHPDGDAGDASAAQVLVTLQRLRDTGSEFGEEDDFFVALRRLSDEAGAEAKALRLCARAEQYSQGLRAKLLAAGYDAGCAKVVVKKMQDSGFVDDSRYAAAWAESRARRGGAGPAAVAAALRARGVGEDAIRGAIAAVDWDDVLARALDKACAAVRRTDAGKRQGQRFLRPTAAQVSDSAQEPRDGGNAEDPDTDMQDRKPYGGLSGVSACDQGALAGVGGRGGKMPLTVREKEEVYRWLRRQGFNPEKIRLLLEAY